MNRNGDVRVSVVVPTYNAGRYLDACIRSLLDQSLDAYEVIFVDDGSSDGTERRLAGLAERHPHVRLIAQPNSGGPGGPRNRGIEAARGDYIYFLDHDDWLERDALEHMYAMATRNAADIVLGKMVGHGRGVPKALFRTSRDRASILDDHLLSMLTPHKLFRAGLIREHEIRFPEGPCRLEDHRFVLTAYFKAKVISVLADHVCCHWVMRDDKGNYSSQRLDPDGYFGDLRAVLDVVDAHTDPGPERDRLYAHWFRSKMLRRLGGGVFRSYPPDYRQRLFAAIRKLTLEHFPPRVDRWLPPPMRVRAELTRADAYADLNTLADAERGLTLAPRVEDMRIDEDGLRVRVTAALTYRDGEPVLFRDSGGRLLWELPVALRTPVSPAALDVTEEFQGGRLDVFVRHRASRADYFLPVRAIGGLTRVEAAGAAEPSGPTDASGPADVAGAAADVADGRREARFTAEALFDPATAREGGALGEGVWDFTARIECAGRLVQCRLGPVRDRAADQGCVGGHVGSRLVVPYWTHSGNLSVRVDPVSVPHIVTAAAPAATVRRKGAMIELAFPLAVTPDRPVELRLRRAAAGTGPDGEPEITVRADVERPVPDGGYGRLTARIPVGGTLGRRGLRRGRWHVEVRSGAESDELRERLKIDWVGRVTLPSSAAGGDGERRARAEKAERAHRAAGTGGADGAAAAGR